MSLVTNKLRSPVKPMVEPRAIFCSTGNSFRVSKPEITKKKPEQLSRVTKSPVDSSVTSNFSASTDDYSSSSSSSERSSSVNLLRRNVNGVTKVNNVVAVAAVVDISPEIPGPVKRCHWITPNSGHFV